MIGIMPMLLKNRLWVLALLILSASSVAADTELNLTMKSPWACKIDFNGLDNLNVIEIELDALLDSTTGLTQEVMLANSSIHTMCNGGATTLRFFSALGGLFVPIPGASSENAAATILTYTVGGSWGKQTMTGIRSNAANESAQTLLSVNAINGILSLNITLDSGQQPNSIPTTLLSEDAGNNSLTLSLSTQP